MKERGRGGLQELSKATHYLHILLLFKKELTSNRLKSRSLKHLLANLSLPKTQSLCAARTFKSADHGVTGKICTLSKMPFDHFLSAHFIKV